MLLQSRMPRRSAHAADEASSTATVASTRPMTAGGMRAVAMAKMAAKGLISDSKPCSGSVRRLYPVVST